MTDPIKRRMLVRVVGNKITLVINKIPALKQRISVKEVSGQVINSLSIEELILFAERGLYQMIWSRIQYLGGKKRMATERGFTLPDFINYEDYKRDKARKEAAIATLQANVDEVDADHPYFAELYEEEKRLADNVVVQLFGDK